MQSPLRLFTLFMLLAMLASDMSAQVSVRRRSSSSSSQKSERSEKASAKPAEKPASAASRPEESPDRKRTPEKPAAAPQQPAASQQPAPQQPVQQQQPTASKKRTAPKKTGVKESELAEGMTLRQQAFAEYQRQEPQYVPWQHVVYRELDMNVGENATLYYPIEPMDGMTNLFRVILEGLCTGQLKAYEYLDGREMFTEKYLLNVENTLQKYEIPYQTQSAGGGRTIYRVEEVDVPSNEVMSYYLKERWQYDLTGSRYTAQVLAICPVVHRIGEYGGETRYPMCWINFEDLRPLLRGHMVMLDGMNNAPRLTMEEYFLLNKYNGELYKVQNTRGLNLIQQYPDSASLAEARERIEAELRGFKDSIWVQEPTAAELDSITNAKREERRASKKKDKAPRLEKGEKRNRRTKEVVDLDAALDSIEAKEEEVENRIETTGKAHSARRTRNK